jgi:hypothetical protein
MFKGHDKVNKYIAKLFYGDLSWVFLYPAVLKALSKQELVPQRQKRLLLVGIVFI